MIPTRRQQYFSLSIIIYSLFTIHLKDTNKQSISFIGCLSLLSRITVRLCGSFNCLNISIFFIWFWNKKAHIKRRGSKKVAKIFFLPNPRNSNYQILDYIIKSDYLLMVYTFMRTTG